MYGVQPSDMDDFYITSINIFKENYSVSKRSVILKVESLGKEKKERV